MDNNQHFSLIIYYNHNLHSSYYKNTHFQTIYCHEIQLLEPSECIHKIFSVHHYCLGYILNIYCRRHKYNTHKRARNTPPPIIRLSTIDSTPSVIASLVGVTTRSSTDFEISTSTPNSPKPALSVRSKPLSVLKE